MQKSDNNENGIVVRRVAKVSTTNRKNMQRPVLAASQNKQIQVRTQSQTQSQMQSQRQMQATSPMASRSAVNMKKVNSMMRMRGQSQQRMQQQPRKTAEEIKSQAIAKALQNASQLTSQEEVVKEKKKKTTKVHFGWGRVMLALGCAVTAVLLIVYFVNLNAPDFSLKVAAMETGIDASYPAYVPRDYSLSDITSESGKVVMNFIGGSDSKFTLIEEASSWDSNALLSNYVKKEYGENYTLIRENGLTIYISDNGACWVNGGILYKIIDRTGSLTKKQIRSIAVSL